MISGLEPLLSNKLASPSFFHPLNCLLVNSFKALEQGPGNW